MGLGRFGRSREERSAVTFQSLWGSDREDTVFTTLSGQRVTQSGAMALTAIYSAVRVISDPVSTFPIGCFIREGGERRPFGPRPPWVDQPDPDPSVARSDHYQQLMVSLLLAGNYYGRKMYDTRGDVLAVRPMDPTLVEPRLNSKGMIEFEVSLGAAGHKMLPARDVVHITDLRKPGAIKGSSRIDELREALGIGKAMDTYVAAYFGQGTVGSRVVISVQEAVSLDQAETIKDVYEAKTKGRRNWHRPNVVGGGGKIERLSDNAEQAQLSAAREFFVLEVARAFKLPPSKLGVTTPGTRAYASVEQDNIDFATTTLKFYVDKIEEAYSRLLFPSQAFIRLNMDSLLRGDLDSRYAAYGKGLDAGWLLVNDVRRTEDMPPIPGGDVLRVPLENIAIDAAGLVADEKRVEMAARLVQAGFNPDEVLRAMGLPPITHNGLPSVQQQPPTEPPADPGA